MQETCVGSPPCQRSATNQGTGSPSPSSNPARYFLRAQSESHFATHSEKRASNPLSFRAFQFPRQSRHSSNAHKSGATLLPTATLLLLPRRPAAAVRSLAVLVFLFPPIVR